MNDVNNGVWILQERFESLSAWETYGVLTGDSIATSNWIAERPNARRMVWADNVELKIQHYRVLGQASTDRGMLTASQYYADY
jgi:hypothetical protein|tara:strand:- start:1381 stop:1629 length:249 start_codon:yes stop_codon:yes gene_type:complete